MSKLDELELFNQITNNDAYKHFKQWFKSQNEVNQYSGLLEVNYVYFTKFFSNKITYEAYCEYMLTEILCNIAYKELI